jgi:hypothetical protein
MVTSPNPPDTTVSAVRGIAAIGPDDIWATGYSTQDRATWNTLIEHWDGAAWTIVPGAVTPAPKNWLLGAGGLTTDDVWAVGQFAYDTYRGSLIEHWDGQVWSVVPEPSRPGYGSYLTGVAPIARDDVWAVGEQRYYDGPEQGLIVHWDGTAWAVVPGANGNWVDSLLWAVSATGPSDVWAVGSYRDSQRGSSLIEHWDGSQWSVVPSPHQGSGGNVFYAVSARSATDVWAVGQADSGQTALIAHWDGTAWTLVPPGELAGLEVWLTGVTARAADDVWAVGMTPVYGPSQALVAHWDGTVWHIVPNAADATRRSSLQAVAVAGATPWAVGSYIGADGRELTLIERYGELCPAPTPTVTATVPPPSPTATATPVPPSPTGTATPSPAATATVAPSSTSTVTPTATDTATPLAGTATPPPTTTPGNTPDPTPLPPTATAEPAQSPSPAGMPQATPTVCAVAFTDVPDTQPFYSYIHCLACGGIVGGYSDGTFRPGANVTRGQLAKFVSNAAGFTDNIPLMQQTFADVPPADPFWLFIERAYAHGVIAGYSDGTFRPTANVTRGQVSKFVANAAQFADAIPADRQSFADVPPADPFWLFVERVKAHDVISGYTCGSAPGGPCDGQNRPYFLPGSNVTRGQTAKFITNSLFPGCPVR